MGLHIKVMNCSSDCTLALFVDTHVFKKMKPAFLIKEHVHFLWRWLMCTYCTVHFRLHAITRSTTISSTKFAIKEDDNWLIMSLSGGQC